MNKDTIYIVERDPETLKYKVTEKRGRKTETSFYKEAYSPDRKQLKEMLEHARGSGRTMAEFAEQCSDINVCRMNVKKITPPIFSRIMQENDIKRPLKAEIIQALLNNAADRDFVNPEKLMRANGLVDETKEPGPQVIKTPFTGYSRAKNERATEDLTEALESKGYKVFGPDYDRFAYAGKNAPLSDMTDNRFDLDIDLNAALKIEDKKCRKFTWGFVIDGTEPEDAGEGMLLYSFQRSRIYEDYGADVLTRVVDNNEKLLLRALIDPASMKNIKISFVCQNRFWYNNAVEELKDIEVDCYISVILIQDNRVVSEFTLKDRKGRRPKCILGEYREVDSENRYAEDVVEIAGKLERLLQPPLGY